MDKDLEKMFEGLGEMFSRPSIYARTDRIMDSLREGDEEKPSPSAQKLISDLEERGYSTEEIEETMARCKGLGRSI